MQGQVRGRGGRWAEWLAASFRISRFTCSTYCFWLTQFTSRQNLQDTFLRWSLPIFAHPETGQAKSVTETTKRWLNMCKYESFMHSFAVVTGEKLQKLVPSAPMMHQQIDQLWVVLKAAELLKVIPNTITYSQTSHNFWASLKISPSFSRLQWSSLFLCLAVCILKILCLGNAPEHGDGTHAPSPVPGEGKLAG